MKFDKEGRVYWDSLTPRQKMEWEYLDIDPTKPKKPTYKYVCSTHFELYNDKCNRCLIENRNKKINEIL